eukprot:s245_g7.t1
MLAADLRRWKDWMARDEEDAWYKPTIMPTAVNLDGSQGYQVVIYRPDGFITEAWEIVEAGREASAYRLGEGPITLKPLEEDPEPSDYTTLALRRMYFSKGGGLAFFQ